MVVLKRNDVGDATHINFRTNTPFLVQDSKEYFYLNNKWILSDSVNDLKPIEKKEMKEFLVTYDNKWTLRLLDSDTEENSYRVAVPSGAIEARLNKAGSLNFIRADGSWMNKATHGEWFGARDHRCHAIVWQRSETEYLMRDNKLLESITELKIGETVKVTIDELKDRVGGEESKYSHYRKDISHLEVLDVYRVLELYNVTNPCVQHAVKKLLCSGQRGLKDSDRDINEAIDSLQRYNEMRIEDENE